MRWTRLASPEVESSWKKHAGSRVQRDVATRTVKVIVDGSDEERDEQIIARILAGEKAVFSVLYDRYHVKTFRLAYRMTGRREQAEDLVQEIFVHGYERLHQFRSAARFGTWFYRLAVNYSINFCRRQKRHYAEPLDDIRVHQIHALDNVEKSFDNREIQQQVQRGLLSLKPDLRAILILRDIEDCTYAEIAEHLQCSTGTVASRLNRARRLLARKLRHLKGRI
jgi:RNA polymerase sigma-70 factor (ECF subfamily)